MDKFDKSNFPTLPKRIVKKKYFYINVFIFLKGLIIVE